MITNAIGNRHDKFARSNIPERERVNDPHGEQTAVRGEGNFVRSVPRPPLIVRGLLRNELIHEDGEAHLAQVGIPQLYGSHAMIGQHDRVNIR
jgi:hypothetical protein